MTQTNVLVSYSPGWRATDPGERRWSVALVGALLAGGAVFTLGHFVAADGTPRETGFPARPTSPLITAEPAETIPIAARMGQPRSLVAPGERLPYLALVRNVAPAPATIPAMREMTASIPRQFAPQPSRLPRAAAMPEPIAPAAPVAVEPPPRLVVDLNPQPSPPPAGGLRRDLEGFLEAQGHQLAVADTAGALTVAEARLADEPAALTNAAVVLSADSPVGDATDTPGPAAVRASQPAELAVTPVAPVTSATAVEPVARSAAASAAPSRPALAPIRVAKPSTSASPNPVIAQSYPLAVVNGEALGAITLRNSSAGEPAIHLGTLVGLLRLRMPEAEFHRLSGAPAADRFVSLDELRAAGITVQLDAGENRLLIDAR